MTSAVIYARVSTEKQAEEELPIASQIDRCRQRADELGADVVRVFQDAGRSGRTDNRPAFQDCIRYCEVAGPDFLITWSSSRFARNTTDAGIYKRLLDRKGVKLVYVHMDVDRSTDGGWLLDGVLTLLDEYYSRNTSADTMRSMVRNAQHGYFNGGTPPYGYEPATAPNDKRRRVLVPQPAEARVTRKIYDMRMTGIGSKQIATVLNQEGYQYRGRSWKRNTVLNVLRSRAVIGEIVFGKKNHATGEIRPREEWIIVPSHEAIIPREIFDAVQDEVDTAGQSCGGSTSKHFVFSGLLRCGECDSPMVIESAKGRSKRYHYYNCRSVFESQSHASVRAPAENLDEFLLHAICDQVLTPENLDECAQEILEHAKRKRKESSSRLKGIKAELADVSKRLAAIYDTIETAPRATLDISLFTDRIRELKQKRQDLEAETISAEYEIASELPQPDIAEVSKAFRDVILEASDVPKLRSFLASFVTHIELREESAKILYKPELFVLGTSTSSAVVPSQEKWLPRTGSNRRPGD